MHTEEKAIGVGDTNKVDKHHAHQRIRAWPIEQQLPGQLASSLQGRKVSEKLAHSLYD